MSHVNISSSSNVLLSGDISDFSGYIMEEASSNLANEFVFDASFFANLFDVNKKVENKKLLGEFGLFWNEDGKLVIHDIKFSGPNKIDYLGNIRQDSFFTKIYRVLGNKGDKIVSRDLAQLVILEYCQKNNIEHIYEPLEFDNKFFSGLFDINNRDKNKNILDALGRKRNEKGEFVINDIYFDSNSKVALLNEVSCRVFYRSISILNGKSDIWVDRKELAYEVLVSYCKNNNIKYIYNEIIKLDNGYFADLFDTKNKEKNKQLFDQLGLLWNHKGELDINNLNYSTSSGIDLLGINRKTFYDNLSKVNSGSWLDSNSRISVIEVLMSYCNNNKILYVYDKPLKLDKNYFNDLFDVNKIEDNKKTLKDIGRKRNDKGEFIVNSAVYSQAHKIESLGFMGKKTFYTYIYINC